MRVRGFGREPSAATGLHQSYIALDQRLLFSKHGPGTSSQPPPDSDEKRKQMLRSCLDGMDLGPIARHELIADMLTESNRAWNAAIERREAERAGRAQNAVLDHTNAPWFPPHSECFRRIGFADPHDLVPRGDLALELHPERNSV